MQEAGSGLFESAKRLLSTALAIVSTRLELLANELQEERLRLTQMFLYMLLSVFCLGMGLLLLTVFVVVLFWDTHRLAVLGLLTLAFFTAGFVTVIRLRLKVGEKSRLFSSSLAELAKDKEQLGADHE